MNDTGTRLHDLVVLMLAQTLSRPSTIQRQDGISRQEQELRRRYAPKVAKWKEKSLRGYAKNLDKQWNNWFREMSK